MTAKQQYNPEVEASGTKATIQFLLEEYRNVAQTHDRLREVCMRLMYFVLVLSAFPFTLAGFIFREQDFDFFAAPLSLYLLFLMVGLGIFVLALALLDARLGQYRYARTVNEIRRYFAEKDSNLQNFLYLPTSKQIPDMKKLGFVGIQLWFIVPIGALFTGYGAQGLMPCQIWRWITGILVIIIYGVLFCLVRGWYAKHYEESIGHKNARPTG